MNMTNVFAISQLSKLVWALIAFGMVFSVLRVSELFVKLNIDKVVNKIEEEPLASAMYLGLRFVGACILVGWVLSS